MKRTGLIKTVMISQSVAAVLVVGVAAYTFWLSGSPEILREPDAAEAVHGLKVGAAATAMPGLMLLVSAIGLWLGKRWSWWLALTTDAIVFAALAYSSLTENTLEWDETAFTMCFLVLAVFLVLPRVRDFYLQNQAA